MGDLRQYLARRQGLGKQGIPRGLGAGVLRRVTTHGLRESAKVKGTRALAPWSRRRARELVHAGGPLRLHLGSGGHPLDGWVNIDILGMQPDLYWDLRATLPFPDASVEAVFLEHVIEHFTIAADLDLLVECRRVLKPGGIVRLGVPDFGRYLESYAGDGTFIDELRPGRPTRLLAVGEVAQEHGHRSVWDGETLELVLREAGFVDAGRRAFGDSDLDPVPDSSLREAESVYAEARV